MVNYFTLAIRTNGIWGAEFGDYHKATVQEEKADRRYCDGIKAADICIIMTDETQAAIDAGIAQLNAKG